MCIQVLLNNLENAAILKFLFWLVTLSSQSTIVSIDFISPSDYRDQANQGLLHYNFDQKYIVMLKQRVIDHFHELK